MSTNPLGVASSAWAFSTLKAGTSLTPLLRVMTPDWQESSRPMRTSTGAAVSSCRSSSTGSRPLPSRSSPSLEWPE